MMFFLCFDEQQMAAIAIGCFNIYFLGQGGAALH